MTVTTEQLAKVQAWSMDFTLVDSERTLRGTDQQLPVREVHAEGIMRGFIIASLPGQVIGVVGPEEAGSIWDVVGHATASDDDEVDALGREVIERWLIKAEGKTR